MTLFLTFAAILVTTTALFWLLSVVVQPYFYTEVAPAIGLRALLGGALIAAFLTGWSYVNTRASHPDKYGTLHSLTSAEETVTRFEAVRRFTAKNPDGTPQEQTVPFERASGVGDRVLFVEAGNPQNRFALNSSTYLTVALLVPGPAGDKVRYDAELDKSGMRYRSGAHLFRQANGPRTLVGDYPGVISDPDRLSLVAALAINFLHFAVWFAVFAGALRFDGGTSLGLAAAFGLLTMVAIMPLLFETNMPRPVPQVVAAPA